MDLDAYREQAERFAAALGRAFQRHYAGLEDDLPVQALYAAHRGLFCRDAVEALRESGPRPLLDFAVEGYLGRAAAEADAELARREAALVLEVDGERLGLRESPGVQANEPDPDRRARIERARLDAGTRELTPLLRESLEIRRAAARELGWPSVLALWDDVRALGLDRLDAQARAFLAQTAKRYPEAVEPPLRRAAGVGLDGWRRSDIPRFFRFAPADASFPARRLVASFEQTAAGLGLDTGKRVLLDVEARPRKSPRAFCAPVRVPEEIHLVLAPIGGRDDYAALLHEGGHAHHFAAVSPSLPVEHRRLGDSSLTEAYAFLLESLVDDPEWLRRRVGVEDAEEIAAHARGARLLLLRRYAAKLGYERHLHGDEPADAQAAADYSRRLSHALLVDWPSDTYLEDVDPGFYVAAYLRAWALEEHLRGLLRERFGPVWFDRPEAGAFLRSLWSRGQRLDAAALLRELTGAELDLAVLA